MPKYETNGVTLYYEIHGEGVPFIFLHGLGGDINQIKKAYEQMENIQLVLIDQRGHGESTVKWDNMNFYAMADDVLSLTQYLGIDKFFIGGISMGAAVSLNFALRYQNKLLGLILIRTAWVDQPMNEELLQWFILLEENLSKEDGKSEYQNSAGFKDMKKKAPKTAESFLRFFDEKPSLHYHKKFVLLPNSKPIEDLTVLRTLQIPTLILSNDLDPIHPIEYSEILHKHIKNSQYYQIESKVISEELHKEQFNKYVNEFISEQLNLET